MFRKNTILITLASLLFIVSMAHAEISNISTRGLAGNGDNTMIAGFAISGSENLKVAIIAGGPTLTAFGVSNVLEDPKLTVYDDSGIVINSNDNWANNPEIAASATVPQSDKEAGVVLTLAPGSYTVHVESANGQTLGTAIVAIENIDPFSSSVLSNISTRGQTGSGDEQMIAGFILKGSSQRLVIVAAGPTLADSGVSNTLDDPSLSLHDGNSLTIETNDNWANNPDIASTSIRPSHDSEAGITTTLSPGSYTVIIGGATGRAANTIIGIEDYDISTDRAWHSAHCVDIPPPVANTTVQWSVYNLAIGDDVGNGTLTARLNTVSETQATTSTTIDIVIEGQRLIMTTDETSNYFTSNDQSFFSSITLTGDISYRGSVIPITGSSSYTPAKLGSLPNEVCEGATWTSPAVNVRTVINNEISNELLPEERNTIVSISEVITIGAGTFTAIKIERSSVDEKIYGWADIATGIFIKEETYDPSGSALTSSKTVTSIY